jgi:integrase
MGTVRRASITFVDLAHRWLAVERKRLVEPENERRHIEHLAPLWELTERVLFPRIVKEHLHKLLRENGGKLSASTVNKIRSTGNRIIRDAQENGEWKALNPFAVVNRIPEPEPEYCVLSPGEVRRFLRKLRRDRRREAYVSILLGPRPGELKALQKGDISGRGRLITIRRSNHRNKTKTGKVRTLPVPYRLWPVLMDAIRRSPSHLVFPAADGRMQRRDKRLGRTLRHALVRAGVVTGYQYRCRMNHGCGHEEMRPTKERGARCRCGRRFYVHGVPPKIRWYDLRHISATLHTQAGCDPLVIKRALGHAVKDTTGKTYVHLNWTYMRRELSKLLRVLGPVPL